MKRAITFGLILLALFAGWGVVPTLLKANGVGPDPITDEISPHLVPELVNAIFTYYISGPNQAMLDAYQLIDDCSDPGSSFHNDPSFGLDSIVSVTASASGTRWFYDHWEDGYDVQASVPGPTTLTGALDRDQSQVFDTRNDLSTQAGAPTVNTPASPFAYDGRDRLTIIGSPVDVIRIMWPSDVNTVLADAWEVADVAQWGTEFVIPVGEDIYTPVSGEAFESTHLFIQAASDTEVIYDLDGPGPGAAQAAVLRQGETLHLFNPNPHANPGGVLSGATIKAANPIQVHMLAGDCTGPPGPGPYVARGFQILPNQRLKNDYYTPSPFFSDSDCGVPGGGDRPTRTYLHNPNAADIDVTWETRTNTGIIRIPSQETVAFESIEPNSGVHFYGSDPLQTFSILNIVDPTSEDYDWGYTPIPAFERTSQVVLGWAPGTIDFNDDGIPDPPTGGGDQNGNLAFVTALSDTVIFVDLDNNGTADPFDMNGDGDADDLDVYGNPGWDEPTSASGIPVAHLEVLRVADPTPNVWDLNGALIYTRDYAEPIAVVWGEDPCSAGIASPHFDGGFTIPPLPVVLLTKDDNVLNTPGSCPVDPDSTITYTLLVANIGRHDLTQVVLEDFLPFAETDFIGGSLVITPPADAILYNGGTYTPTGQPGQPDPNIESWQAQWQTIPSQSVVTATFAIQVDSNALTDTTFILNQAQVRAANLLKITLSRDIDVPGAPGTITCVNTPTPTATATSTPTDTATPSPTTTPPPTATPRTDTATPPPTAASTLTATPQTDTATPPSLLVTPSPTSTPEFPSILPETGGMLGDEPENVFFIK